MGPCSRRLGAALRAIFELESHSLFASLAALCLTVLISPAFADSERHYGTDFDDDEEEGVEFASAPPPGDWRYGGLWGGA